MRVSKIIAKNYRSFDSKGVEIELPDLKLPFSIVGHNNSGKSNLLNSIAYCLGAKTLSDKNVSDNDFYLRDPSEDVHLEIKIDPPLKSSDAFNGIKDMPVLQLKINKNEGIFRSSHSCCDINGNQIFNAKALKRSTKKIYTEEEKAVLNEHLKQGAEQVWKWKSKIPVYYIDSSYIQGQLKINNFTLLGKVINEIKKDFESEENKMEQKRGIVSAHVGKTRKEVYDNAMKYLEDYVLSTPNLEELIKNIEEVIEKQLEIESDMLSLKFGFPSTDIFFNNLSFYLSDNPEKPKLPIEQMGKGFTSLFVVALFRAILKTSEGGNIFLIEEPETFLHEHFQEYYYNVLCELAKNNQIIYTTHSKKFVNVFEPRSIIKLKNTEYLKSEVVYNKDLNIDFPSELDGFSLNNPSDFPKYLKTLEPNIGNIIFASKVIIVEGPHDVLAYKSIFENEINLSLNNIAIVAAWGKDSISTIIQLCKRFEIPFFVIHDWDLDDDNDPNQASQTTDDEEKKKLAGDKAQWTKNQNIIKLVGDINIIHHNKRNLEAVLKIAKNDKGPISVFEKVKDKKLVQIKKEFPQLLDKNLLNFLEIAEVIDKKK